MEMKGNDKIGPYKVVDYQGSGSGSGGSSTSSGSGSGSADTSSVVGHRLLFALVHADLQLFLVKIEQLRHVSTISLKQGLYLANQHLKPFIESALIASFDTSHLVDFHETFLLPQPMAVRKIKPLIAIPGALMVTSHRIYFQPAQLNNISDTTQSLEYKKIVHIYKRRHMLRSIGLEFLCQDGASHFYIFDTSAERDQIYSIIYSLGKLNTKYQLSLEEVTKRWQRREISNFDYLMHLNNEAGRSLNDLTQYPVFPHIIQDYSSKKLNLDNPATFRDLSKPIGALNADRLKWYKERYASMPPADPVNGIPPPFLYGTHYSTPGYVLFYLVRVAPEYMLCLQNGRFDAPDRMFHSVGDMWESVVTNPADLKELIPEFFTGSGDFLVNYDDLDLGHRHSGERLHDVVLPPWADSPRDYIRKHIKALESEYVNSHIHKWIDLIFGYKQQGAEAIANDNLYYYLTYEGSVEVESIRDSREKAAIEAQIQEFGQCPRQLFSQPHPCRNDYSNTTTATGGGSGSGGNAKGARGSASAVKGGASTNSSNININNRVLLHPTQRGYSDSPPMESNSQIGFQSLPPPPPPSSSPPVSSGGSRLLGGSAVATASQTASRLASLTSSTMLPMRGAVDSISAMIAQSISLTQSNANDHSNDDIVTQSSSESTSGKVKKDLMGEEGAGDRTPGKAAASGSSRSGADHAVIGGGGGGGAQSILSRSQLKLVPSEAFYWHSKAVTALSLVMRYDQSTSRSFPSHTSSALPSTSGGLNNFGVQYLGGGGGPCPLREDDFVYPRSAQRPMNAVLFSVGKDAILK
eukprot:scaffold6207_cov189-Ochromonas_danica.AAC.5